MNNLSPERITAWEKAAFDTFDGADGCRWTRCRGCGRAVRIIIIETGERIPSDRHQEECWVVPLLRAGMDPALP